MNTQEMRDMLSEQMKRLHNGKGNAKDANAIVNAAGKIIATVRLEMEYLKLTGGVSAKPKIAFLDCDRKKKAA